MAVTLTDHADTATAIIDVGSNSVRLVVFGGDERAPLPMHNEKSFCSLGLGVTETGRLNPEGVVHALKTLKRYGAICKQARVRKTIAFATAAVRDASDGDTFVERVKLESGLELRVLSGGTEAHLAGLGVMFGLPDADGLAADMGGSSLELVGVSDGTVAKGISLPLGPLRFANSNPDPEEVRAIARQTLSELDPEQIGRGRTLYLVGGTWRAFAKLDIGAREYGLNIIHGYEMSHVRALDLADLVSQQSDRSLIKAPGVSRRRINALPVSAMVLGEVLKVMQPKKLVFSAHGVREGAYMEGLPTPVVNLDPLLCGAGQLAVEEARFDARAGAEIFDWIAPLFTDETASQQRLRKAACLMCEVGWRTHPDYRATQSCRRVLRSPLIGITHPERCFLGAAVLSRYSHNAGKDMIRDMQQFLDNDEMLRARRTGAAMRLALSLGAGTTGTLVNTSVSLADGTLTLTLPAYHDYLISDAVRSRLEHLAGLFGVTHALTEIG